MSKKKKYFFYKCRDCTKDFLSSGSSSYKIYCPICGEYFFTEKITEIWIERPFQYKRPWTTEEDEIVTAGKINKYSAQRIAESLDGRTARAVNHRWYQIRDRKEQADDDIPLV